MYVGNRTTGNVIFMPPPPEEVPVLMSKFIEIHPFVDGNGRTARALATLILHLKEFDIKKFFVLDDYYDSDRIEYYNALKSVEQETLDLTDWLEYFTDGVLLSISKVKIQKLFKISRQAAHKEIMKLVELNLIEQKGSGKAIYYVIK